ncbi:MAG: transglycosylase SLT domain-containing protein [Candidatus Omnitrophica bacterium]|nr:transglycosylase SLT domain-containing protein [Candidatus Omnitrophota bacterium]MBU1127453.1 transglycosylase SLT domain-containing protein [Candidatus Omnitrophota bacterium]MBU1784066.1 transglycosylase SLT domain-containing protein [Candidatus Omnitrophota bacterium]MBU1852106.1 transglycosylase SLT domain-containing protein [Candidatus Omnitrophota bacterium]
MAQKQGSNVDAWLERETDHTRKALENASRHFDENDSLTVNTLEAVYGQESSFGGDMRKRGITGGAGHFMFEKPTAERYGLTVTKKNDQRFDVDDASDVAARYLKDLDAFFSKETNLGHGKKTMPVKSSSERKKFALAAYNGGEGRIASAQKEAVKAGKNPSLWKDVKQFLKAAGATVAKTEEIKNFLEKVLAYEIEFAKKSPADKKAKKKKPKKSGYRCTGGRWRTIDDQPVMICD